MGKNTTIAWTETVFPDGPVKPGHTWNPWQGCRKVSPGCKNCYMYRDKKRFAQDPEEVVRSRPATFNAPLRWKEPAKVFVCSWSDFFIEEADEWRDEAWTIIEKCEHLTFLLLTKRPERIIGSFPATGWPKNAWLGVTAENQEQWERRVKLLQFFPKAKTFVSIEPMLDSINITNGQQWVDWIICGGESGPNARAMNDEWARSLLHQSRDYGIPFFMKQMSGGKPIPDCLRVREFPNG